jgi:CpeT protein
MSKVFLILFAFLCLNLTGFGQQINNSDLKKLLKIMAGEFNSEEQSKTDSSFFHIKLRMKPIWKKSKDGYWLYVEQSLASAQDKPYRQRVYHVYIQDDSTIVSKVYEIRNATKYTGGWKNVELLKPLRIDSLIDRQGCGIFLHKKSDSIFGGSTPGRECLSSLRGATYATSEVVVSKDVIISWDRGWDLNDKQVWGAVKSGYIFRKTH